MKSRELKVARIGNSRGIRLPAETLERYQIGDTVMMEERSDGILLQPRRSTADKLSWQGTADAMALENEDWSEWDHVVGDGIDTLAWLEDAVRVVAEPSPSYKSAKPVKRSARGR